MKSAQVKVLVFNLPLNTMGSSIPEVAIPALWYLA